MVPSAFVMLERLPLTSNGKLDRAALPVPDERAVSMRQYVAPRNELERKLCDVWAQVLGLGRVGIEDNFFAIGGDSILSLRVLTRSQALGVTFGVADLFRHQSIAQLISAIEVVGLRSPPRKKIAAFELLNPGEREQFAGVDDIADAYPLSLLQEGMYFHSALVPDSAVYHDVFSYCIDSAFHREHFEHAVRSLVHRHPVLRTAFVMSSEHRLVQIVHKSVVVELKVEDVTGLDSSAQDSYIQEWIDREKHQGFVWSKPPLLRLFVQVRDQNRFQFGLSFHHTILDGWSVASLQTELLIHYFSLLESRERVIEAPRVMYRDYIAHERQALQSVASQEYWIGLLDGTSLPQSPKAGDARGNLKGHEVATYTVSLESEIGQGLERCAQQLDVHLKLLLLAAHVKVMSVVYGEQSVLTGLVSHGRLEEEDGERVLGLHLNSLPVRVEVRDGSWRTLVMRLQNLEATMLPHRHYPLAAIQTLIGRGQLFDTVFNFTRFHIYREIEEKVSDMRGFEQTNFSLVANFSQALRGPGVLLSISFDPAVFDRGQIERMGGYYRLALTKIIEDIDAHHHKESLLSEEERYELLVQFNRTSHTFSPAQLIHELFEEQVERTPEAVAVVCETQSLTYSQIDVRANQLARLLREKGVGPDKLVGICVERSVEMVVGLLGILKAGGAYVPLDPNHPTERLQYMVEDAAIHVVLTQERLKGRLQDTAAEIIALDKDRDETPVRTIRNVEPRTLDLSSHHLAYVIYTSGTTGQSKGVMVEHRNVANLIHWHCAAFDLNDGCRCSSVAAVGFDAAAWEIWPPLSVGATLVLASPEVARDAEALLAWWESQPLDVSFLPTPIAEVAFGRNNFNAKLRTLLVGGDRLRYRPASHSFSLVNNYGPTESTVVATSGYIYNDDVVLHIGRPIANTKIYILDQGHQPVPMGTVGEIYIGGSGVARGYLNRPELTAERFIADPFSSAPQARMYRSGDMGRWRSDATIEYLGRNDRQVKVRGFRIELAEIEAQLLQHFQVKDAVVIAREDVPGEKRLVAYITQPDQSGPSVEELREHLKMMLPEYMVPSAFVILESLPLTPNGKLDRCALLAPEIGAYVSRQYEPPQGEVEVVLSEIWQELLRLERVGRQDNFFELGGHSLLATLVISRIRELLQVELPIRALFDAPTLRKLSVRVKAEGERQAAIETYRTDNLARDLREEISGMEDDVVMARLAELEKT
jgi:amino acid adenylation domain-containing protein